MAFPITRFRVKSEWPKLIGVAACVLLLLWATVFTVSTPSTYKQYADYVGVSSGRADSGLEGPGSTVAEEEYQRYLAEHRDFLFSKSVEGSAFYVYLSALALAMLLVCAPLQRGTAGLWIGAGASRGKVFAALGLGFLLPLLLVGGVAFAALREHFNLRYTGEELAWFRLAGYSWFLILLACGAVPFLFSFVFGKGLPAGLCSLAAWFLLGLLPGAREVSPFGILRRAENWLPEAGKKPC